MLWRAGYSTPVLRDVKLPMPVDCGPILIVLLSPDSLSEAELWRRLISAELPDLSLRLTLAEALSTSVLAELLPPSLHEAIVTTNIDWTELAQPDRGDRALALVVSGRVAKVLMIGPPTEDAWDEFKAAALVAYGSLAARAGRKVGAGDGPGSCGR